VPHDLRVITARPRTPTSPAASTAGCLIVDEKHAFLDAARGLLERDGLDFVGVATEARI